MRVKPAIAGLTEPLVELDRDDWNITCRRLEELGLLTIVPASSGQASTPSLDAHPLIREYFAAQLKRDQASPAGRDFSGGRGSRRAASASPDPTARQEPHPPDQDAPDSAWTEGHRRVFEHLCENTEHRPATIEGLAPLYQAVAHGCHAGLHEKARADVYRDRILRGTGNDGFYSSKKLGAIGADLGAVACFFDRPWSRPSPHLSPADQAWLLNEAAVRLRALGRLTEAAKPMRASIDMVVEQQDWMNAAIYAGNLSELELTLGEVSAAVADAELGVEHADRSKEPVEMSDNRTTHADALHQASRGSGFQPEDSSQPGKWQGLPAAAKSRSQHGLEGRATARQLFVEAEVMQAGQQPEYPRLYSLQGFQYCDLLLSGAERAAWQSCCGTGFQPVEGDVHGLEAHATRMRRGAYLPHLTREGGIYSVTFRLTDSLPAAVTRAWRDERQEIVLRAEQQGRALSVAESRRLQEVFSDRVEHHLNAGSGTCWMRQSEIADLVQQTLQHFDGSRYRLLAWCVMPNHVHVIVQPLGDLTLDGILHSWKSFSASQANGKLDRSGPFWQAEYYDHLIRDEADLEHAVEYVLGNPRAAGLVDWKWVGAVESIRAELESGTGFQPVEEDVHGLEAHATACDDVTERATQWLEWRVPSDPLLDIALIDLTLSQAVLYRWLIDGPPPRAEAGDSGSLAPCPSALTEHLTPAVDGLREGGRADYLPRGLLTRAWQRALTDDATGAVEDLDEAWEFAERGPMRLFQADILLYRVRLFGIRGARQGQTYPRCPFFPGISAA